MTLIRLQPVRLPNMRKPPPPVRAGGGPGPVRESEPEPRDPAPTRPFRIHSGRLSAPGPRLLAASVLALFAPHAAHAQEPFPLPPGVDLDVALSADAMGLVRGGLDPGWELPWNVDLQLSVDGSAFGWEGGRIFVYGLGNGGGDPTERVGDFQVVSNIAAPETWKVFEAWVEQRVAAGSVSALAGLYDLNSEFDVLGSAQLFLNSSFGIGPDFSQSCLTGPSIFPTTSLAFRLKARPAPGLRVQAAVLDGVPGDPEDPTGTQVILDGEDGVLVAGELAWFRPSEEGRSTPSGEAAFHRGPVGRDLAPDYDLKLALGGWGYSREFERLEGPTGMAGTETGTSMGIYGLAEARVFEGPQPGQGLWAFGRAGLAREEVNRVGSYLGGGVSGVGLLPGRDRDELGLGVAAARNGDPWVRSRTARGLPSDRWEVALELTYLLQLPGGASLQPDLQWIVNPGMDPEVANALILGLRGALVL